MLLCICDSGASSHYVGTVHSRDAGVLVSKLSQLTPLSKAKRDNPMYFMLLYGISCELAGCVRTYRGLRVHDSRLRPNQI
jgi:hypothetical protein